MTSLNKPSSGWNKFTKGHQVQSVKVQDNLKTTFSLANLDTTQARLAEAHDLIEHVLKDTQYYEVSKIQYESSMLLFENLKKVGKSTTSENDLQEITNFLMQIQQRVQLSGGAIEEDKDLLISKYIK